MKWIISTLQVLVGEFIAVQIQNVSVFSPITCVKKITVKLPSFFVCFFDKHQGSAIL